MTPRATAPKTHKAVRWRTPSGGKRRPGVIDATRAQLVRALEHRSGSVWLRVGRLAPIAGYAIARALDRVRAWRSDGVASVLAMAVALLYLADVRTGFVGKPRPGGGPWQRYTLPDLAQLAYGGQTEADIRRARRAIDVLTGLGWVFPTRQVRRYVGENEYRSEPAVRRLNLSRLCEMVGTSWLLKRDRQHAEARHGSGAADLDNQRRKRQDARTAQPGRGNADAPRSTPPATGDPPAGGKRGPQMLADILALLK